MQPRLSPLASGLAALAVTALGGLASGPAAEAAVSVTSFQVRPSTTQAGAHPDVTIASGFASNPSSDDVKDVTVRLAPGLVGNPLAADRCSGSQFAADACPAGSRVGSVSVTAQLVTTLVSAGDVYDLRPTGGEPARLGIVLRPPVFPKIFLQAPARLVQGPGGYALETTFANQPRTAGGLPIRITSIELRLLGRVSHGSFMRNPTSCKPAVSTTTATSYDSAGSSTRSSSFVPTGCGSLPFAPRLVGTLGGPGRTRNRQLVPLSTTLTFDPEGAALDRVEVALPGAVQPAVATLSNGCSLAAVDADACPASSQVGTARVVSPLNETPLNGVVYIAASPTALARLVVRVRGPVALRLDGDTAPSPNGLVTTFAGTPDLPLQIFTLSFAGGRGGLLEANRDLCGPRVPRTIHLTLVAHSGKKVERRTKLRLRGCAPRASARIRFRRRAGALVMKLRSGTDGPRLSRVRLTLPRGLRAGSRRLVRVSAGGHKVSRKRVRARGRTLSAPLPRARTVRIAWGGLKKTGRRKLGRASLRVRDAAGRSHRLRVKLRRR